ncbi:hypothetical protein MJA45_18380 [Paenibacillus aurantius]|uniref:Uncharacterized protein n=1 Tax=Paenibacillus aurantius TaxID=2918900 RepID=A0AA96LC87_9BACL|nr:hypothetical protein [Paenibacillus aurantius]WNQ09590.1 hypothetical protein MJA45_18380 [Paenibacillus aurantius]
MMRQPVGTAPFLHVKDAANAAEVIGMVMTIGVNRNRGGIRAYTEEDI